MIELETSLTNEDGDRVWELRISKEELYHYESSQLLDALTDDISGNDSVAETLIGLSVLVGRIERRERENE